MTKNATLWAAGVLGLTLAAAAPAQNVAVNGAGASFPYPLYSKWAHKYNGLTGVKVNYQSIGSGGGINAIKNKTVDFAGSDAPLTKDELDKSGLAQFPMVIGGVTPVLNVPGVLPGQLKLTSGLLADIFLGKVTKWNDAALTTANPGLKLPDLGISVVHRSDGSGTTWLFTNYLDRVSVEWHMKVGCEKSVKWPTGVGAKGNEGVAANVKTISGAIGYVEYAYAIESKMCHAQMRNRDGNYVQPTTESFAAAAAGADWKAAPGFHLVLTDQPGAQSWPITGASFILLQKERPAKDLAKAQAAQKFFDWCFTHGDATAKELNYVPMPDAVVETIKARWAEELTVAGAKLTP
jgi:phosphate transport system substrate-binding protein